MNGLVKYYNALLYFVDRDGTFNAKSVHEYYETVPDRIEARTIISELKACGYIVSPVSNGKGVRYITTKLGKEYMKFLEDKISFRE